MCRPKSAIIYIEACGHYRISRYWEEIPPGACPRATKRRISDINNQFTEWSPCATLICELEAQRKNRWEWDVTIDGVVIHVSGHSGGHCENWRNRGFKPPDYRTLAETEKAENQNELKEEEEVASSGSGTSEPSTAVESGVSTSISTTIEVDDHNWEHSRREGKRSRFKRRLISLLN